MSQSLRDEFPGSGGAFTGTRTCDPGPGSVQTVVASAGPTFAITSGELVITPGGTDIHGGVRETGAGRSQTAGTAVYGQIRYADVTKLVARIGWFLSTGIASANQRTSVTFSDDANSGTNTKAVVVSDNPSGTPTSKNLYFQVLADGQTYAVACEFTSTDNRHWIQGGIFDTYFGATVGSNVWFPIWFRSGTYSSTMFAGASAARANSTIYVDNLTVESAFAPSGDLGIIDLRDGGYGVTIPSIKELASGALIAAWQNGSQHGSNDIILKMAYRTAAGVWGSVQSVVTAPGGGTTNRFGTLAKVGNNYELWYFSGADGHDGATLKRRVVTITEPAGTFSAGSETGFTGISRTDALVVNPPITLGGGRILMSYHRNTASLPSYVAYSDDTGANWTEVAISAAAVNCYEPSLVLEPDGSTISCWFRTASGGVAYRATSTDNGATWTTPASTSVPCPVSRLQATKLADGRVVVVGNDNTGTNRRKVTAWLMNGASIVRSTLLADFGDACHNDSNTNKLQYPCALGDAAGLNFYLLWSEARDSGALTYSTIKYRRADLNTITGGYFHRPRPARQSRNRALSRM